MVDFERARLALHRVDVLMRGGRLPEALADARVAAEIAARGFLAGERGAWVEGQRQLLADVRRHALAYTVEAELLRGHADTAERSHALLMRASAAAGNASSVPRLLRACRRILAADGLQPSPPWSGSPPTSPAPSAEPRPEKASAPSPPRGHRRSERGGRYRINEG